MRNFLQNQTKYIIGLVGLGTVLFWFKSTPFLKIAYDPWFHLSFIRRIFEEGRVNYVMWPGNIVRYQSNWHSLWAHSFKLLNINDTFLWAEIIYKVQFIIIFVSVFVFSYQVFRLLINRDRWINILLAIISTLLWFIGIGTVSLGLQQTWINWYAITAQCLSMAFFWFGASVILEIFWVRPRNIRKNLFLAGLLGFLFIAILFIHELEFVYLLIFLTISVFVNMGKIYRRFGMKTFTLVPIVSAIGFVIGKYILLRYLSLNVHGMIVNVLKSFSIGKIFVEDRSSSVLSEIVILSLVIMIVLFTIYLVCRFIKGSELWDSLLINSSLFVFLAMVVIAFFLIPVLPYLSVIVGRFTDPSIVWRFRFPMPWFIFLPLFSYVFLRKYAQSRHIEAIKIFIVSSMLILTGVIASSAGVGILNQNIISLENSYNDKLGAQYNQEQLGLIGQYMDNNQTVYLVRGDIGYLSTALYGRYVLQTKYIVHTLESNKVKDYYNNSMLSVGGMSLKVLGIDFDRIIPLDKSLQVFRNDIYRP